jgi:hypothetical protein
LERKLPYDQSIYVRTYFFLDAGYVWGQGMPDERFLTFSFDVIRILSALRFDVWKKSGSAACFEGHRGHAERLYCHPMDLVGWVKKDKIDEISEALKNGKTFTLRNVKTHEEALYYTEEELKEALELGKVPIAVRLLEHYTTKRRNLYKESTHYEMKSGVHFVDRGELRAIENRFISDVFDELVASARILRADGENRLYRTATSKELREMARPVSQAA